jgi:hypothetical protein
MSDMASKVGGGVLLLVTAVLLVVLSGVPYNLTDGAQGMIRLSWRYRIAATQECRTRTQEELDALPVHMRTPEVCERGIPSYRMSLWVDGNSIFEDVVRPAGAAGDRPLYVHRDHGVPPGEHRIEVRFFPLLGGDVGGGGLSLDRTVTISPGEVVLVTHDPNTDRLEVVDSPEGG